MTKLLQKIAIAGATAFALMAATTAFAADGPSEYQVKRTTNSFVNAGVKAFKKGDYPRAIKMNETALKTGLSKRRKAIVQSNLCASYAMLGDMDKASDACETAIALRPDYAPAQENKQALVIKLAQK